MSNYYFETSGDVSTELSGFGDWDWGDDGKMDFDGFCDFVWENHDREPFDSIDDAEEQMTAMLAGYCVASGGTLSDWAIRHNGDVERAAVEYGLSK